MTLQSFCPLLQELVEYNRKFAAYYDSSQRPPMMPS